MFLNCVERISLSRGAAGWTMDRVRRIVSQGGFNYIRWEYIIAGERPAGPWTGSGGLSAMAASTTSGGSIL